MRPSSAFSAVGRILLEWFWSSLKGRVVPNRCKVVLSDHLYAGMKPFYPEGSGLFPSQAARGCRWWKLCQEWHLIPSLEFQRLVQRQHMVAQRITFFLYFVPSHQPPHLLSCSLSTVLSPFPSVSFPPSFSMSHPFSSLATSLSYSFHFLPHSLPPPQ